MAPHRWLIITLALGLLVTLPTAEAQRRGKIPLVGVLEPNPSTPAGTGCFAAFQQGLRDLGYVEGQNITFAYRYAANQFDRLPTLAAELVQLTPDVIWMHSNAAALAAKQAITTIPVVNAVTQEILELGVVESLARPGGNLTGLDVRVFELMGKRLELLKEATSREPWPPWSRVGPTQSCSQRAPHWARTYRSSWSWRTGTGCRPCVARRNMPRRGAC